MQTADAPADTPFGLCRLIGQIRAEVVSGIESALSEAGLALNFSQFLALKKLGDGHDMAPGELARILNYSPGAMTRLLDKLERLGYIERVPAPGDRRSLRLELTARGRAVHARMIDCGNAAAERGFVGISAGERHQLHGLLERVLERMHSQRASRASA